LGGEGARSSVYLQQVDQRQRQSASCTEKQTLSAAALELADSAEQFLAESGAVVSSNALVRSAAHILTFFFIRLPRILPRDLGRVNACFGCLPALVAQQ
jgi:hypothetical protein